MPTPSPSPSHSYSRSEIITAVQDFYSLLIKLPYIFPDALVSPPAEGWSSVNTMELRSRGKTEEVIELLRHLPYLRAPASRRRWMIGPNTIEIAYCDGEIYAKFMDDVQPVPGHCIWLMEGESRDGTSLLLDTHAGTITEWSTMEHRIMIDYEAYEKLPAHDKWMAHPTMGATAFFRLWKRKFERLIWMALYNPRGVGGTAQWYTTATSMQDEEDMLASDDDFDPDGDEHEVDDTGGSASEDEDDVNEEDEPVSKEEVDDLVDDAYGEEARKQLDLQSQRSAVEGKTMHPPSSNPTNQGRSNMSSLDRKTKEVHGIYTLNGWPSDFHRESCRIELAEFLKREEGPVGRSQEPMTEQDAMMIRQNMIQKRKK